MKNEIGMNMNSKAAASSETRNACPEKSSPSSYRSARKVLLCTVSAMAISMLILSAGGKPAWADDVSGRRTPPISGKAQGGDGNGGGASSGDGASGTGASDGVGGKGADTASGLRGGAGGAVGATDIPTSVSNNSISGRLGGSGENVGSSTDNPPSAGYAAGGGGGGAGVYLNGEHTFTTYSGLTITGGNGGQGGSVWTAGASAGGGGGGGGAGAIVSGGATLTNVSGGAIQGGNGGLAGAVVPAGTAPKPGSGNRSGMNGTGGSGVVVVNGTFINNGNVNGGDGNSFTNYDRGISYGGAGIQMAGNATVINSGYVQGGATYNSATDANKFSRDYAVTISGNNNTLELDYGYRLYVTAGKSPIYFTDSTAGTGNTLKLGGDKNASFDVSTISKNFADNSVGGFNTYEKSDTSTWALANTTTLWTPWTITGGELAVSADASLGALSITQSGSTVKSTITVNGGGYLKITGTTYKTTQRNIDVDQGEGGIDVDNATNVFTLGGDITGAGKFKKEGAGTLVLTNTNVYTGGTEIKAGTLQVGSGSNQGTLGTGAITDNGVLAINRNDTYTIAGAISGTGSFVQQGTGTTVLTADNDYQGITTISAGTLQLGDGGTTGGVTGDIANEGTLVVNRSNDNALAGQISGSGKLVIAGTGTTTLSNIMNNYQGGTELDSGTLAIANDAVLGTGALTFDGGTLLLADNTTLTHDIVTLGKGTDGKGGTISVNGGESAEVTTIITGSGALTKGGDGTLVLTGVQAYTGNTVVAAGTLQLGNGDDNIDGSLAAGTTVSVASGATLAFNEASSRTFANVISGDGSVLKQGTNQLVLSGVNTYKGGTTIQGGTLAVSQDGNLGDVSGGLTFDDGTLQLTSAFDTGRAVTLNAGGGTINIADGDASTFSGKFTGAGQLTKMGGGTLTLSSVDSDYTGRTDIQGGVLAISDNRNLGNGGELNIGGATLLLTGDANLNRQVTLGNTNSTIETATSTSSTISGLLTGTGRLLKIGDGTLVLTDATNNYSGGTEIDAGTLSISSDGNLGAAAGGVAIDAGTLQMTDTMTLAHTVTLKDTNSAIGVDASKIATISSAIGGSGKLNKTGDGTLVLANAGNNYSGGTEITAGTLQLGNGTTDGAISGGVTVDQGATLAFNNKNEQTFGSVITGDGGVSVIGAGTLKLTGTNNYTGGTTIATSSTLQIGDGTNDGAIVGAVTNNGTLAFHNLSSYKFGGAISGNGIVDVDMAGTTLTLSGISDGFQGTTNVQKGYLYVDTGGQLGGDVAVASGATLGGDGTLLGDVTVASGGTLKGEQGAQLNVGGNLALSAGSIVNVTYGTDNSQAFFNVTGNLNLGGATVVADYANNGPGIYRIFNYGGTLTGVLNVSGLSDTTLDIDTANKQVNINYNAGLTFGFWNGSNTSGTDGVQGGTGTWDSNTTNWSIEDGSQHNKWSPNEFAIFEGTAGTVTVVSSTGTPVSASGMQFMVDGYVITGGDLTLDATGNAPGDVPFIQVQTGTATIESQLLSDDGFQKSGSGTLVLTADQNFTGQVNVSNGTLQLGNGGTTGSIAAASTINLMANAKNQGTVAFNYGAADAVTVSNVITGEGRVKIESGTVTLSGVNSYTGFTSIEGGSTLVVSSSANVGAAGNAGIGLTKNADTGVGSTLRFAGDFEDNRADGGADNRFQHDINLESTGNTLDTGSYTVVLPDGLNADPDPTTSDYNVTKTGSGTLVLTGIGSYEGTTTVADGKLQIGDAADTGQTTYKGNVTLQNDSILAFDYQNDNIYSGLISGTGSVELTGPGTTELNNANNDYMGGTTVKAGTLKIESDKSLGDQTGKLTLDGGALASAKAVTLARQVEIGANGGTFDVDKNDDLTLAGSFTGAGDWTKTGPADLIFAGGDGSSFAGSGTVQDGTVLLQDYTLGGNLTVGGGGELLNRGTSTVKGDVTVQDQGKLSVADGNPFSTGGNLVLNAGSNVNVTLGVPTDAALITVGQNLTLGGTLHVNDESDPGGFGAGVYTIFQYGGTLTGSTMTIESSSYDASRMFLDTTSTANEVNLVSAVGVTLNYWDGDGLTRTPGTVQGGDGTWDASNYNWTNHKDSDSRFVNGPWDDNSFAVFMGNKGTVTIKDGENLNATGMQFKVDGYVLQGGSLTLNAANGNAPKINVGDGNASHADITATIQSELKGTDGLEKTNYGTLILTGANSYTGITTVSQGVLQLGNNTTTGSILGNVVVAQSGRTSGTLAFDHSDDYDFKGNITGGGAVVQKGNDVLTLSGQNTFSGGLTVASGGVKAGSEDNAFGAGLLTVNAGATADLNGHNTTVGGITGAGKISLGSDTLKLNQTTNQIFSGVIDGSGGLNKDGIGVLTLLSANTYTGTTSVTGGTLKQGAAGVFDTTSSRYDVGTNGNLDLGGFDTTLTSLSNAGTINMNAGTADTVGTTLTVAHDYTGQGGTIVINTVLGGDDSKTDRLKVGGDTSGTTNLQVVNRGGLGAQTTKGIEVVEVGGQSNGTFSLLGDYTTRDGQTAVVGGAYAYTLHQGVGQGDNDGNWYLTSQLSDSTDPDNPDNPRYGAGVPVYQGYVENMQALNRLPTLQERVGNRYWTGENGDGQTKGAVVDDRGIWARIEGAHNRLEPQSATGMKQDINTILMQAGVDGQFYEDVNGRFIAGITGQYGRAHGDSRSFSGDGTVDTNAWSLGATATWYGNNGFYVDGQSQVTWFDNDLNSDTANVGLKDGAKAFGYALSVEAGQRVAIDDHWSLTPQAQLMWSSLDADAFQDVWGSRVSVHDGNSFTGRLGLAANYRNDWKGEDGLMVNTSVYGIANLYQEFLGGTRINVAGVNIDTDNDRTWAGIGAGGTYAWADNKYAVYGEGSINTSLNHFADSYTLKATAGFKVKW